jgi:hypothetical protein
MLTSISEALKGFVLVQRQQRIIRAGNFNNQPSTVYQKGSQLFELCARIGQVLNHVKSGY